MPYPIALLVTLFCSALAKFSLASRIDEGVENALSKRSDNGADWVIMCICTDSQQSCCDWKEKSVCTKIGANVHWLVTGVGNGWGGSCVNIWGNDDCTINKATMSIDKDTVANIINTGFYIRSYKRWTW